MGGDKKMKQKPPKVSVIIPTYNRADLLPRTIESVLNQTFKNFELIIVDDGSTDNTEEVVKEFQERDERVRYIWQENSGGAAKPKNNGIKNSRGDYIAILDSDDEWLPDKLVKQLELFESSSHPELGFVDCNALMVDEKSGKHWEYRIPPYKNVLKEILARDYMGSGSGIMYKKSVFDTIGLFDENLKRGQDWEIRIRIAQKYGFDCVDEPLYKYYVHSENLSSTLRKGEKVKDLEYVFNKYKKYYEQNYKICSTKLRYTGTTYVLTGQIKKARQSFLKSIKTNPLNLKSYACLGFSLFGSEVYYGLTQLKMRLRGFRLFDRI